MRCFPRLIKANWHASFDYGGVSYTHSLRTKDQREAEVRIAPIRDVLYRLENGNITMPAGTDPKTFILSGGRIASKAQESSDDAGPKTVGDVFDVYFKTLTKNSKSKSSLVTERVHEKHFKRLLGDKTRFDALSVASIQKYIDRRAKEGVVRETLKKELGTLRVVWNWASKRKHLASPPTWSPDDLTLPKGRQKPPFQTREQIERRIVRGDLDADGQAELWESLWLDKSQTRECLSWVEANAPRPFLFPMFAFAIFTGARRGEMVRSERTDWDFDNRIVRVKQKKSDSSKEFTTRDVPIHPKLSVIMNRWFATTPNAVYAIEYRCKPVRIVDATKWFRRTVDGGPWSVLRGWHVWRHSLASNMAASGIDQRVIDATLGHSTDAMARRYRHLLPSSQSNAIDQAFDET